MLCVTAHALLPLSLSLSPSLRRKSAGVTAKAAHTHSHADRKEASTNPKEDFSHHPLLLLPLPLSNSFAHEWSCCQSAGPGSPADHTMRKIRNWPIKSIRRNFSASLSWHPQTRSTERKRKANRGYSFSANFCAGNKCLPCCHAGLFGCGLQLKDMVMVNHMRVVFMLTKSLYFTIYRNAALEIKCMDTYYRCTESVTRFYLNSYNLSCSVSLDLQNCPSKVDRLWRKAFAQESKVWF